MHARSPRVMGLVVGLAAILAGGAFADVAAARPAPQLALAPLSGPAGTWVWVRGSDFRPRGEGVVVFGADPLASFRATRRGTFRVGFVVPAGDSGLLGLTVRQTVRGRHGSLRRLDWASAGFRVVVDGFGGGLPVGGLGGLAGGPAGGSEGAPGSTPGGSGGAVAPPTPAVTLPPVPKEEPKEVVPKKEPAPKEEPKEPPKEEPKEKPKEEPKETPKEEPKKEPAGSRWVPPQQLTWYLQLQGTVNNSETVEAYDIDGFENTAAEVATMHAKGIHAICYIDVGTWEEWRPDASEFPASVLGNADGWPGENWLDIRQLSVLEPIMTKRFQMCKEKGFDAVGPDNMDGYENSTGFPLTAQQQLTYNEWIAGEVHSLGMAVFQKNDSAQTSQLEPYFDGALVEQCNQYHECGTFQPYLTAGKPVLDAEYELPTSSFCTADKATGIMGALYGLELNGTTFEPCW